MTSACTVLPDDGGPPSGWVPVESRWLGLDRRTLVPGIVVAVVGIIMSGVLPSVSGAIAWSDPIAPGDRVPVGPSVVVAPPVGWQLTSGTRSTDDPVTGPAARAELTDGGVTMELDAEASAGELGTTLEAVTDDIRASADGAGYVPSGDPVRLSSSGGLSGVVQRWTSTTESGIVAVLAVPATGGDSAPGVLVVQASGPGTALDAVVGDVDATIRSATTDSAR